MAREAGLDLASVTGTGPSGLVRREDVRRALAEHAAAPPAAPGSPADPAGAGEKRIPLRGARRVAADKLTRSRREIPEATVWVDVDATGLLAARQDLNADDARPPVSLLALLARFALLGLRRYPELNARIDGGDIVLPDRVHLGFAAQTERGLVVPVVRDAHRLSTRELSAALTARTAAARAAASTRPSSPAAPSPSTTTACSASTARPPSSTTPRWRSWAWAASSTAPGSSMARSPCARWAS